MNPGGECGSTGYRGRRWYRSAADRCKARECSEGDRSPPVTAAAKKEPPSANHERVGVFEHGRPRKSIRRCYVLAMRTRTGSHAKSPRRPPFRQLVGENAVRVLTAHRPPSDTAHKRRDRAKSPQSLHPAGCLIFIGKAKPRRRGCPSQPLPLSLVSDTNTILPPTILPNDAPHARPRGGGGLPMPAASAAAP